MERSDRMSFSHQTRRPRPPRNRWLAAILASAVALGVLTAGPVARAQNAAGSSNSSMSSAAIATVDATTEPMQTSKLAFPVLGIIKAVAVKDGDVIKKGQVLMQQDDEQDLNELEQLKQQAESNTKVEAAEADVRAKQARYDRVKKIFDEGNGSQSEVEEAENDLVNRQKQLQFAKEEKQIAGLKAAQQQIKIAKMKLVAPFDGAVQKVVAQLGESVGPQSQDGAIQIVNNDPLKVVIRKFSTLQASTLKLGQKLPVRFINDGPNGKWQDAEVSYIAPQALAGDVQEVFLSLPNQTGRSSGEHVAVRLTPELIKATPKDDVTVGLGNQS
jgi:RND family efflux transporter MFP subunit